jgi:hypothetical protein
LEHSLRASKYLLLTLAVVIVLIVTGWILRNSIIERISGPMLAEYGLSIRDVSLDALATKNARIRYLELEHENGTTIAIDELTLPLAMSSSRKRTFTAKKVTVAIPADGDTRPVALAQMIGQLLLLPHTLTNTEIQVSVLDVSPYPAVDNVNWISSEHGQQLAASVGAAEVSVEDVAIDESGHDIEIRIKDAAALIPEQSITVSIEQTDAGLDVKGKTEFDLPAWDWIVESFSATLGTAELIFDGHIPTDVNETAIFSAGITPSMPAQFAFSITPDDVASVSVRSASTLKLRATYPQKEWSVSGENVSVLMSYGPWNDMSVIISDLECTSVPACSMNTRLAMDNADLTIGSASRLELAATHDIVFDDDSVLLHVLPEADISMTGLDISGTAVASVEGLLTSAAKLELTDSGWQLSADSVAANVESLSLDDDMAISAPLALQNLSASDLDGRFSMNGAIDSMSSQISWASLGIAFPGFKGDISLQGDQFTAELTTVGLHEEGAVHALHDLAKGTGQVSVSDAALSFDVLKLSNRVSPWEKEWDISAGSVSFDLQFSWEESDAGWQLDGASSLGVMNLAGFYTDTVFTGLSTNLVASYDSSTGTSVEPASLAVALLEIGLPVENITADYTLHPDALSVEVENLRMRAFGGVVTADPFSYELDSERNTLLLRAESIKLTELLTLKEMESIELSGRIGAVLPVIIEGAEVSILDGTLTGEQPGGVIRYRPGVVPSSGGTSAVDIVTEALSNFEYDTLTSSVGYSKDGDLVLQMRITGRNPDMKDSRPVVLNLGVENNVPKMLKSLQAARAVEDILEKRISK